jgi:hypothetical protein
VNPNPTNPMHNPSTSSDSELQCFTDPPGGLPLDSPEVVERERRRQEALAKKQERKQSDLPKESEDE